MPRTIDKSVSFGSVHVGLTTVGYQLINAFGTVVQSRTTAGVIEVGGGVYKAYITFPDGFEGIVYWDTAPGSSIVATEEYNEDDFPSDQSGSIASAVSAALPAAVQSAVTQAVLALRPSSGQNDGISSPAGATTRAKVRAQVLSSLGPTVRAILGDDPFLIDEKIDAIADEICRETRCWWRQMKTDLVSGQETYCIPEVSGGVEMFEVVALRAKDSSGAYRPLRQRRPPVIDAEHPLWRSDPEGVPTEWVYHTPSLVLAPVPNYTALDGLIFEGYCTPGRSWAADESSCPLPGRAVEALVNGACARLLIPLSGQREYQQVAASFSEIFERGKARLKADVVWQGEMGERM